MKEHISIHYSLHIYIYIYIIIKFMDYIRLQVINGNYTGLINYIKFRFNLRSPRFLRPASCLKAPNMPPTAPPPPLKGKNQCAKSMAPRSRASFHDVKNDVGSFQ